MNRQNVVAGAIAVILVAAAVGAILYSTKDSQVHLAGSLSSVRTHAVDTENPVLLADVRITNPTKQQFVVRDVQVFSPGRPSRGPFILQTDDHQAVRVLSGAGQKYNSNLVVRQKINAGEGHDRMVTVSFKATERQDPKAESASIVIADIWARAEPRWSKKS